MPMFTAPGDPGRRLLERFGDIVEYRGTKTGVRNVQGIVDKSPEMQDPYQAGGKKVRAAGVLGYVHMDDIPGMPQQNDVVSYEGESWRVKAPYDDGMRLWAFTLEPIYD